MIKKILNSRLGLKVVGLTISFMLGTAFYFILRMFGVV